MTRLRALTVKSYNFHSSSVELPDYGKVLVTVSIELEYDSGISMNSNSIFNLYRSDIA